MRCKKEISNAVFVIKSQNLREDGKRRVVYHDVGGLVFLCLIISLRDKGANKAVL